MKSQIILTAAGLIRLGLARADLQACILDLAGDAGAPYPPLHLGVDICEAFSFVYGPTTRYCSSKDSVNYGVGIHADEGSTVTAIFPFSRGQIIHTGNTALGGHDTPHVLVKHNFNRELNCEFKGEKVNGIYIDYLNVKASDTLSSGVIFPRKDDYFPLGTLVHKKDCFCPDNPNRLPNTRHPHSSLVIKLYVDYDYGGKSHPIPPAYLFDMGDGRVTYTPVSIGPGSPYPWHKDSEDDRYSYFHSEEGLAIRIQGHKCQTHYNKFYIGCSDACYTKGSYNHFIYLDDPDFAKQHTDSDYRANNPHFVRHYTKYDNTFWRMTLVIPSSVTSNMWSGVENSCYTECTLMTYDITGKWMGSFSFRGASRENCPEGFHEDSCPYDSGYGD